MDHWNWDFNSEESVLPQSLRRSTNVWCLVSHQLPSYMPWLATWDAARTSYCSSKTCDIYELSCAIAILQVNDKFLCDRYPTGECSFLTHRFTDAKRFLSLEYSQRSIFFFFHYPVMNSKEATG
jgi:hypothetical protein